MFELVDKPYIVRVRGAAVQYEWVPRGSRRPTLFRALPVVALTTMAARVLRPPLSCRCALAAILLDLNLFARVYGVTQVTTGRNVLGNRVGQSQRSSRIFEAYVLYRPG